MMKTWKKITTIHATRNFVLVKCNSSLLVLSTSIGSELLSTALGCTKAEIFLAVFITIGCLPAEGPRSERESLRRREDAVHQVDCCSLRVPPSITQTSRSLKEPWLHRLGTARSPSQLTRPQSADVFLLTCPQIDLHVCGAGVGAAAVAIGFGVVLAVVFLVTFLAFCAVSRSLVRSVFMIPFVALRLQLNILSTTLAYALRGFRPLYPQWTLTFEITCKMMRFKFEEYGEIIVFENAALMREPFAMHGRLILKSNCRKHNTRPEQIHVNGMDHMWLRDFDKRQQRIVVIHYHGGGFAMSDPLQDVELANQTHSMLQQILRSKYQLDVSVDVLLSNYRKSPESPFPTPDNDCLDMYKYMYVLKHENISSDHVLFSGDSAGAKMSLVNCVRMRDSTPELLPLGCLLYSPSVSFDEKGGDEKTPDCIMPSAFVDAVHQTYLAGEVARAYNSK